MNLLQFSVSTIEGSVIGIILLPITLFVFIYIIKNEYCKEWCRE